MSWANDIYTRPPPAAKPPLIYTLHSISRATGKRGREGGKKKRGREGEKEGRGPRLHVGETQLAHIHTYIHHGLGWERGREMREREKAVAQLRCTCSRTPAVVGPLAFSSPDRRRPALSFLFRSHAHYIYLRSGNKLHTPSACPRPSPFEWSKRRKHAYMCARQAPPRSQWLGVRQLCERKRCASGGRGHRTRRRRWVSDADARFPPSTAFFYPRLWFSLADGARALNGRKEKGCMLRGCEMTRRSARVHCTSACRMPSGAIGRYAQGKWSVMGF